MHNGQTFNEGNVDVSFTIESSDKKVVNNKKNDEVSSDKLGKTKVYINMSENKNENNKGKMDTNKYPFKLIIEEPKNHLHQLMIMII